MVTNAERRERRREAARKGLETRRRKAQGTAAAEALAADPFAELAGRIAASRPPEAPRLESAEERARRADLADEKRTTNLRAVLRLAQEIRRESDLYYHAAHQRWPFSPKRWTAEQIESARQFLEKFKDPKTGQWDHRPMTRRGKARL